MKSIFAIVLLCTASVLQADIYGPTNLECAASVFWGNDALTLTNDFGTESANVSASYGDDPFSSYFSGTAVASAEYGRVYIALTVGAMPSSYSQQAARASARFTDTFAACGPIGTGSVVFSAEEQTDITTVVLIGDQTNSSYAISQMSVIHNGVTNEPIGISFGEPFTFSYGIEGQAGFDGTNQNTIEVKYEYIRKLVAMSFYDAEGSNVTDGVTVVSESGALYPRGPALSLAHSDTNLIVSWHSVTNVVYGIAGTGALDNGGWSKVVTNIFGVGSTNHAVIPHSEETVRFLRLETE